METECLYILLCKSSGIFRRSHFELLKLKFAQFGEEYSNHEWTPIDTNRSVQFVFIRGFFLIVCGCGYAGIYTKLGVGHAAIKLTTSDGEKLYITWSAQGNPLNAPFKFQRYPRFKHLGTENFGYADDKECMEGFFGQKEPHYKIKLPVLELSNGTLTYGISAIRIAAFWEDRLNERMYAFFSGGGRSKWHTPDCTRG